MFRKIISGGSYGADTGALKFALEHKIEIDGIIKKGYKNDYKLHEKDVSHSVKDKENVDKCDALIAFRYSIPKTGKGTDMTITYTISRKYTYIEYVKLEKGFIIFNGDEPVKIAEEYFTLLKGKKPVLILWDANLDNLDKYIPSLLPFILAHGTKIMISGPISDTVSDIENIVYCLLKKVYALINKNLLYKYKILPDSKMLKLFFSTKYSPITILDKYLIDDVSNELIKCNKKTYEHRNNLAIKDFVPFESYNNNLRIRKIKCTNLIEFQFLDHLYLLEPKFRLTSIDLHNNEIDNKKMEKLSEALKTNIHLTSMDLHWNIVGAEGAKYLSEALKVNSSLTFIDLENNQIGLEGVKHLCEALKVNSSLTSIDLGNNQIGLEGMKHLCEALKVNSSLTKINLGYNQIGDEGMKHLCEALKVNSSLTKINLVYNQIGDEGMKHLSELLKVNLSLISIYIWQNQIGDERRKYISETLKSNPNRTIIFN